MFVGVLLGCVAMLVITVPVALWFVVEMWLCGYGLVVLLAGGLRGFVMLVFNSVDCVVSLGVLYIMLLLGFDDLVVLGFGYLFWWLVAGGVGLA